MKDKKINVYCNLLSDNYLSSHILETLLNFGYDKTIQNIYGKYLMLPKILQEKGYDVKNHMIIEDNYCNIHKVNFTLQ